MLQFLIKKSRRMTMLNGRSTMLKSWPGSSALLTHHCF